MTTNSRMYNATRQQTVDGKPINERLLRRAMRINILAGSGGMIWAAAAGGMPLTMYMECIRSSGVLIGLIAAVQQLAMLIQIPAAFFSERLQSRKSFWASLALAHRALWIVPAILPFILSGTAVGMGMILVLTIALSSALAQASSAPWWSWMADLIPERWRNRFWSLRSSVTMAAYLTAMIVFGWLLDFFPDPLHAGGNFLGFTVVFGIATLIGCADIIIHIGVPEPKPRPTPAAANSLMRVLAPLRNHDFRMLTLAMGFWTFASALVAQTSILCLKREFDVTYTQLSLIAISSSLGVIVAGPLWGYVMDRLGARNFGAITMALAPAWGLCWFFMKKTSVTLAIPFLAQPVVLPQPIVILLVLNFVAGMFYSGVGLCQYSLLGALAPRDGRTMAMAMHWGVVGLLAALGPVTGGFLMDHLSAFFARSTTPWILPTGARLNFFHILQMLQWMCTWGLAVPCILAVRRRAGEPAFRTALARFMIINPIRIVNSIYNIYSMGVADTRSERAYAVRKLGEDKTAIAVADLVAQLDDPSLHVQVEAAMALGRIGSQDATDALVARLLAPESDLVPEIARALAHKHNLRAVDALIARLAAADRESASAIAQALGEIGDRRAAPALLDLLKSSQDTKVVMATAEALAGLGEFSAVHEIIPRIRSSPSARLRRALLADLGDLLGEPGVFYGVLAHEQKGRGQAIDDMVSTLRRALQHVVGLRRGTTETDHASALLEAMDLFYLDERRKDCARVMFDLGLAIARLDFGRRQDDPHAVIQSLIRAQEQFGVGLLFLDSLRDAAASDDPETPGEEDLILGFYILANWARRYA